MTAARYTTRLEDRDVVRELDEHTRYVNEKRQDARPYEDMFPQLRGRAESSAHKLVVTAHARGTLSSVAFGGRSALSALTSAAVARAFAERGRRGRLARILDTGDRKAIELAANPPAGYERSAEEEREWSDLDAYTLEAIGGNPAAIAKVRECLELPVIAQLYGPSGAAEDYCETQITGMNELPDLILYPNLNEGRTLGQHVHWAYRRAVAAHREWHAREVEDRRARLTDLDPALPVIRRFGPLPELVEDEATRTARESFERTLKITTTGEGTL